MGEPSLPALQTAVLDILEDSIKTPGVIYEELQQQGYAEESSRSDIVALLELMRQRGYVELAHGEWREYTASTDEQGEYLGA